MVDHRVANEMGMALDDVGDVAESQQRALVEGDRDLSQVRRIENRGAVIHRKALIGSIEEAP